MKGVAGTLYMIVSQGWRMAPVCVSNGCDERFHNLGLARDKNRAGLPAGSPALLV